MWHHRQQQDEARTLDEAFQSGPEAPEAKRMRGDDDDYIHYLIEHGLEDAKTGSTTRVRITSGLDDTQDLGRLEEDCSSRD